MVETTQIETGMDKAFESVKMYRNCTSKGVVYYNWEIKIIGIDIDRLKEIDNKMQETFKNSGVIE